MCMHMCVWGRWASSQCECYLWWVPGPSATTRPASPGNNAVCVVFMLMWWWVLYTALTSPSENVRNSFATVAGTAVPYRVTPAFSARSPFKVNHCLSIANASCRRNRWAWSFSVTWQRWRSHHSIRHCRNPLKASSATGV